jgi:hypothetical protein
MQTVHDDKAVYCLTILGVVWKEYDTWKHTKPHLTTDVAQEFANAYKNIKDEKDKKTVWSALFAHQRFCTKVLEVLQGYRF